MLAAGVQLLQHIAELVIASGSDQRHRRALGEEEVDGQVEQIHVGCGERAQIRGRENVLELAGVVHHSERGDVAIAHLCERLERKLALCDGGHLGVRRIAKAELGELLVDVVDELLVLECLEVLDNPDDDDAW